VRATRRAKEPHLVGDLVLCAPVVAREAKEQGKLIADHYAHLIVHGCLHLQGYDHEHDADALRMERRERRLLKTFGIDDPYRP
jgi:probable rRNA maturation factor